MSALRSRVAVAALLAVAACSREVGRLDAIAADATDRETEASLADTIADDAGSGPDAPDSPPESHAAPFRVAAPCVGCAPRAISPRSGAATALSPTMRWEAPPNADQVRVEICATRDCAIVEQSLTSLSNTTMPMPLHAGVHFWRLTAHSAAGWAATSSPVWSFLAQPRVASPGAGCNERSDYNGDGYADVAVGVPVMTGAGGVSVFLGSQRGFGTVADNTIVAPDSSDAGFGVVLIGVGDVNGDGYDDLIAGDDGGTNTRPMYLYLGGPLGLAPRPSVALADPSGNVRGASFGIWGVHRTGDLNSDGFADVLLSAASDGSDDAAYVYYGRPSGLVPTADAVLREPGGTSAETNYGRTTAGVGDVNGDGFDDIAVGAIAAGPSGRLYLYYGTPTGITSTPSIVVQGPATPGDLGGPIAAAGDVNGDGYADILVSAMREGVRTGTLGRVYVVLGGSGATLTPVQLNSPPNAMSGGRVFAFVTRCLGDVDGDSYDDIAIVGDQLYVYRGSATGPRVDVAESIARPSSQTGFDAALCLGDLDGDGYADVAASVNGAVYIFHGSAMGLVATPAASIIGSGGNAFGSALACTSPRPGNPGS